MSFLTGGPQNTFKASPATGNAQFTEQNLLPAISTGQNIFQSQIGQANQIFGQQGDLAAQLRAQAAGEGPNLAAMQLKQATDRNAALAAGQIASQRGMNPALAARLIAQNQAAANQQAAGQAGLLRAQQQLAAQGQLANVYGQQAGQSLQAGSIANQNLGINQQALAQQNADIVRARGEADRINADISKQNAEMSAKGTGGLLSGLGTVGATVLTGGSVGQGIKSALIPGKFSGGEIKGYSEGGESEDSFQKAGKTISKSIDPDKARAIASAFKAMGGPIDFREGGHVPGQGKVKGDDIKNDTVPAMLSPKEVVLPRSVTMAEDAPDRAKEFMIALKESKKEGPKGYAKILDLKRKMGEIADHMEDMHEIISKIK